MILELRFKMSTRASKIGKQCCLVVVLFIFLNVLGVCALEPTYSQDTRGLGVSWSVLEWWA